MWNKMPKNKTITKKSEHYFAYHQLLKLSQKLLLQPKFVYQYVINLLQLFYKQYRNWSPRIFDYFLAEYRGHHHNFRNYLTQLSIIRCKFKEIYTL